MASSAARVIAVGAAKFGVSPVGAIIMPNLAMGSTRTEPLKQLVNEIGVVNRHGKKITSSYYFGKTLRESLSNGIGGTFVLNQRAVAFK